MRKYFEPEMNISVFDKADVVTTSGATTNFAAVEDSKHVEVQSYGSIWND